MADTATRVQSGVPRALHQLARAIATDAVRLAPHLGLATRAFRAVAKLAIVTCVLIFCAIAVAVLWALARVPADDIAAIAPSVLVESANGQPLGRVGPLADAVRRQDLPDVLVKAVLSIEDRRFYHHYGIDPLGVTRALWANWNAGEVVEGGSTITQQLAKMRFVGAERSFDRKLREALTAIWLDFRLGKDEVLTQYLNGVYLGAGAHGVSAASRVYFDKDLRVGVPTSSSMQCWRRERSTQRQPSTPRLNLPS